MKLTTQSGKELSKLGIGAAPYNNYNYGPQNVQDTISVLERLLTKEFADQGVIIDMGNVYGFLRSSHLNKDGTIKYDDKGNPMDPEFGESEKRVAQVLKKLSQERRAEIFLTTKAGRYEGDTLSGLNFGLTPGKRNFDPDYIEFSLKQSMARLGVDCLDLLQLHGPYYNEENKGQALAAIDKLHELKSKGTIRYAGVSVNSAQEGIDMLRDNVNIDSLQVIYNLLEKQKAEEVFRLAQEKGVSILSREVLARGFLTGKYRRDIRAEDVKKGDLFSHNAYKIVQRVTSAEGLDKNNQNDLLVGYNILLDHIDNIINVLSDHERGPANGESLTGCALRYSIDHPAVDATLVGMKKQGYVPDIMSSLAIEPFSEQLRNDLQRLPDIKTTSGE